MIEILDIKQKIFFKDQFFRFGSLSRFAIQLLGYLLFTFSLVLSLMFVFSQNSRLQYLGLLILIFVIDLSISHYKPYQIFEGEINFREKTNSALYFTRASRNIFGKALRDAEITKIDFSLALFYKLMESTAVLKGLARLGVPIEKMISRLDKLRAETKLKNKGRPINKLPDDLEAVGKLALLEALEIKEKYITDYSLFLSLFDVDSPLLNELFIAFNLKKSDLINAFILISPPSNRTEKLVKGVASFKNLKNLSSSKFQINRPLAAKLTPYLDKYSIDLTDLSYYSKIGFLVGHQSEFKSLISVLTKEDKNKAVLIGELSSGKDTIVSNLALQIIKDNVPESLKDSRLISLNISKLASSVKNSDEILNSLKRIADEILEAQNVILYIQDFYDLEREFEKGAIKTVQALSFLFNLKQVKIIWSITPEKFRKYIELDPDLNNLLEVINVEDLSDDEAIRILSYGVPALEKKYKIAIDYKSIKRAVILARRYLKPELLPASAEKLIRESINGIVISGKKNLEESDILNLVSIRPQL